MPRGGKRKGAGRPAGVPNKKTREVVEAVEESGETPLNYLLRVMRDKKKDLKDRIDAAKSAAPYCHAKLSNIEVTSEVTVLHDITDEEMTPDEWEAQYCDGLGSATGTPKSIN